MGKILAYSGVMQDYEVTWMPSYGPEMRGGTANVTERGKKLLKLFETYEEQLNKISGELFQEIFLSGDLF